MLSLSSVSRTHHSPPWITVSAGKPHSVTSTYVLRAATASSIKNREGFVQMVLSASHTVGRFPCPAFCCELASQKWRALSCRCSSSPFGSAPSRTTTSGREEEGGRSRKW